MKAVRIHEHGGPEVLFYEEIPDPEFSRNQVLVRIKAAALNHLDIWIRNGLPGLNLPLPLIPGSDGAGIIEAVGENVEGWKIGDEVVIQPNTFCGECEHCKAGRENYCYHYGIIGETQNGVLCELYAADPVNIFPKAGHLTFEEAASMQLVFLTSYQMLVERAKLKKGETVLIYGAGSGIGSAAIQIAHHMGAKIISTIGDESKRQYAEDMGSEYIINHADEQWESGLKNLVGRNGIDVIFEHPGSATWEKSLRLLNRGGRIVTCGATTGPTVSIDLRHLFMKQQSILGSTMSSMTIFREVMIKINEGHFKPFVDSVYPLKEIKSAHQRMEERKQLGKIVVLPG